MQRHSNCTMDYKIPQAKCTALKQKACVCTDTPTHMTHTCALLHSVFDGFCPEWPRDASPLEVYDPDMH